MWIGHGQANQWPATEFHGHISASLKEDKDLLPFNMTEEEVIGSYLLVLLGIAAPAGEA